MITHVRIHVYLLRSTISSHELGRSGAGAASHRLRQAGRGRAARALPATGRPAVGGRPPERGAVGEGRGPCGAPDARRGDPTGAGLAALCGRRVAAHPAEHPPEARAEV